MSVRRDEIVDIAKKLFAAHGYAATSMRDIADASGLLSGSLYSHFRSKGQILELAIAPLYDALIPEQERALALDAPGAERVEAMLRATVRTCAHYSVEITILHYDWPYLRELPELGTLIAQSDHSLELWRLVLRAGFDDGSLRRNIHPEVAQRVVTSAISGVIDRQRYADRPDLAAASLDALADRLVAMLLGGLRAGAVQ